MATRILRVFWICWTTKHIGTEFRTALAASLFVVLFFGWALVLFDAERPSPQMYEVYVPPKTVIIDHDRRGHINREAIPVSIFVGFEQVQPGSHGGQFGGVSFQGRAMHFALTSDGVSYQRGEKTFPSFGMHAFFARSFYYNGTLTLLPTRDYTLIVALLIFGTIATVVGAIALLELRINVPDGLFRVRA